MTNIKDTWEKRLGLGESAEREFIEILRKIYPSAHKINGNFKQGDVKIPEINKMAEIKYDYMSDATGNLAIEYGFRGNRSGIAATKSDYWIITDKDYFYCFKTNELMDLLRINWDYLLKTDGGDQKDAKMILIDKEELINQPICITLKRKEPYFPILQMLLEK